MCIRDREISGSEGMVSYDRSGLSQPIKVFARNQAQRYFSEKVEHARGWLFPTVDEIAFVDLPVSYTHLDVYKRQPALLHCPRHTRW